MHISIFDERLATIILVLVSVYGIISGSDYGVLFCSFAGSMFYITSVNNLYKIKIVSYFMISYITGVICSEPLGTRLALWMEYTEKSMEPIAAVIFSAVAVKLLTILNSYGLSQMLKKIYKGPDNVDK